MGRNYKSLVFSQVSWFHAMYSFIDAIRDHELQPETCRKPLPLLTVVCIAYEAVMLYGCTIVHPKLFTPLHSGSAGVSECSSCAQEVLQTMCQVGLEEQYPIQKLMMKAFQIWGWRSMNVQPFELQGWNQSLFFHFQIQEIC